jgi:hypothetical protein
MNIVEFLFTFSTTGILISLWICWCIWGVTFFPPKVYEVQQLHMKGLGLALPGCILIVEGEPRSTLFHEQTHVLQMRRYSPIGVAIFLGWHYGGGFLKQRLRGQPGDFWILWQTNPLEIEANERMYDLESPLRLERVALINFLMLTFILIGTTAWCLRGC